MVWLYYYNFTILKLLAKNAKNSSYGIFLLFKILFHSSKQYMMVFMLLLDL